MRADPAGLAQVSCARTHRHHGSVACCIAAVAEHARVTPGAVHVLAQGQSSAQAIAKDTMRDVKAAMGLMPSVDNNCRSAQTLPKKTRQGALTPAVCPESGQSVKPTGRAHRERKSDSESQAAELCALALCFGLDHTTQGAATDFPRCAPLPSARLGKSTFSRHTKHSRASWQRPPNMPKGAVRECSNTLRG